MSLPNLPYKPRIRSSEIVDFRGLDRTDAAPEGALYDAENISTARWPVLSPRGKREKLTGYSAVTDMYEWDGHIFTVSGTSLLYDGEAIGTVTAGKKQWAVVNTQLCIFPDKITVDLSGETPSVKSMEAEAAFDGYSGLTVTDSSISAPIRVKIETSEGWSCNGYLDGYWYEYEGEWVQYPPQNWCTYTYGKDMAAVGECWDGSAWDLTKLSALEKKSGFLSGLERYGVERAVEVGDIFILDVSSGIAPVLANAEAETAAERDPDRSRYNTAAKFGVVTSIVVRTTQQPSSVYTYTACNFAAYEARPGAPALYDLFSVGDTVSVAGTPAGIADNTAVTIRSIDEDGNALHFDDNSFRIVTAYKTLDELLPVPSGNGATFLWYGGKRYQFRNTEIIEAGVTLFVIDGESKVYLFRDGEVIGEYAATVADVQTSEGSIELSSFADGMSELTITRSVPDMDYVCESGNRLWGVSNKDNKILASALGNPAAFETFDGLDTDSYQLAVGSEGDFTAICAYGGGVCCWKERRLHKVIGSYPSEYYTADYRIEGVAAGSDRSLTVVNETLFYNGVTGVYAYAGGSPQSIGYPLGGVLRNAAGGTDGKRWYLSGLRAGGEAEMLVYDLVHRLWAREDDTLAVAFCTADGVLHFLSDGEIWQTERGDPETTMSWAAEFAQFTETAVLRKYYLRLNLRVDMEEGSTITVKVREDDGDWRNVCSADALRTMAKRLAILPRRCDRFRVRIEGTGNVVLRAMTREYLMGSERL